MSEERKGEKVLRGAAGLVILLCGAVSAVVGTVQIAIWVADGLTRTFANIAARWSGW